MQPNGEVVETDSWRLVVPPHVTGDSPILCIPTVHPRGDRRVIRCAQVALDAGFRLSFVWLGEGEPGRHPAIEERLLPTPASTKERLLSVRTVARVARDIDARLWHIHDFYMLGQARRWHRKTGRPVVYDVHEYYGEYYASKLPLPGWARRFVGEQLDRYQARTTRATRGGANLVAEAMRSPFDRLNVPVAVSPNYPSAEQFREGLRLPFAERSMRLIHTGSLNREYGSQALVRIAKRALDRDAGLQIDVMARFSSQQDREDFMRMVEEAGNPPNLRILDPVPTHEMPELLASYGFGLSLLQPSHPQVDTAVASKLYEYAVMGLVIASTDGRAAAQFISNHALGFTVGPDELDLLVTKITELRRDEASTEAALDRSVAHARARFTWEGTSSPALRALYARVVSGGSAAVSRG
jgi:glycosyltransferase involved in cell wall biosynthesis